MWHMHIFEKQNNLRVLTYMDLGSIGDPSSELFSREASNLQLVGVCALGLSLGRKVDERWGRVHA